MPCSPDQLTFLYLVGRVSLRQSLPRLFDQTRHALFGAQRALLEAIRALVRKIGNLRACEREEGEEEKKKHKEMENDMKSKVLR